ncbi:MAG: efflux RND transporter permease subunit [Candidatus Methylacidiphilales bacterium]|nr:efflux RND transporter permease subunit [Candidatus Methylacidiphilales bacterium]
MTLSDLSIKRPVMAWMLMAGLIVFGAISLGRLGVSYMPDVDFPQLDIEVTWEGAAPEIMEAELVDQIEQKVIAVEGLKELRSNIRQGAANITMEFVIGRDIDAAVQEVQSALTQVRLPLNVDPPVLRKQNPEDDPIMWIGLSSSRPFRDLIEYIDLYVADQFQTLPGVGELLRFGFTERNLRVHVRNHDLQRLQLSVLDVVTAVRREHSEIAAGYIENSQNEINLRTMGEGLTAEQVGNILITQRGGQPIYDTTIRLRDVADVVDDLADARRILLIDGRKAVGLGIKKQRGSNEVAVATEVIRKVEELKRTLPEDIKIRINVDFTRFVVQSIHYTEKELVIASLLTAVICFLFLGNWSSSVNVLLSIPTSILGTFIVIYFMGFTLNLFTMLALTLVIGIVVDDAIMVLENIVRHFQMGKSRVGAARDGAREITFAAVAASVAVMAIFLPVAFMEGVIGKFFFQFGVTISAAVALSLLEAVTLTPMRCSQLMVRSSDNIITRTSDRILGFLGTAYGRGLRICLDHRWKVVTGSFVLFALSLLSFRSLRQEFVPTQDQNFFRMALQTPVGSSLENTFQKAVEVEKYLKSRDDVARYLISVGGQNGQSNSLFVPVVLIPKDQRKKTQSQIMDEFRRDLPQKAPGVRILALTDLSSRGLVSRNQSPPVEFNIRGTEYSDLKKAAAEITRQMEATGLMVDVDTNYREGQPEVRIVPDREAAALRGVSMDDLGQTVLAAMGGLREGKFTSDARRYDVRIRLRADERLQPADIEKLQIRTSFGELIPLSDVVKLEPVKTVQSIARVDRQRSITIRAALATGVSQSTAIAECERISRSVLPEGYSFHLEGSSQTFQDSFKSLNFVFVLGLIAAYMVLASQFNSFIHPVTVLLALPFSVTGAFLILLATGQSINLFSMIGLILLAGIVKKNSILLVEFTNQVREHEHLPVRPALEKACPIRLRPILMTSFATMGAAIPTALSTAPGSEARVPMALTIIGGVAVSTSFTLFVVPCAYSLFARFERHHHEDTSVADELEQPAQRYV